MTLAVDEACTNVIRHAYGLRTDERIRLRFQVWEDRAEIQVRDSGMPPEAGQWNPRDLEEVKPGGLGLHFIRGAMDEVHYEAPEDGGCLLRLVKYRRRREDQSP
jgi:anti-sigma regulatory factor (Ser/Thr protein kinase)